MVIGRAQRRAARTALFERELGGDAPVALDLVELTELAWHDCYGEPSFSDDVLDDLLVVARGSLSGLVTASHLAVTDRRDLRVAADAERSR